MKKLISLVLTLCLAASFAACSNDSADTTAANKDTAAATEAATDAATDAETDAATEAATEAVTEAETEAPAEDETSIYGTWKTSLDFSKLLSEGLTASAPDVTIPEITGLVFDAVYELKEDGTSKIMFTEESVNAAITNCKPSLKAALEALYTSMAGQMDMTLEQMLEASGTTIDAIIDETLASFEDFTAASESKFLVEGNKIYDEVDENGEIDKTQYTVFTLTDSKLTFTEVVAGEESDAGMFSEFLPIVFEKQ